MRLLRLLMTILLLSTVSCTTILVHTTGSEGIQEDPTERTAGTIVEDESIETKILVNLKSQEPAFRKAHFQVYSHNGVVLMVGQVPTQEMKVQATEIASRASAKIKRIHNELEVIPNSDIISRGTDAYISTRIRTMMLTNRAVPSDQVKVITENSAVFLMGLVSQTDGNKAADLARNVSGVRRVVKIFEYVN